MAAWSSRAEVRTATRIPSAAKRRSKRVRKRISPRNISAEHQYVRVETGKDRARELRQLFAVDVEKDGAQPDRRRTGRRHPAHRSGVSPVSSS